MMKIGDEIYVYMLMIFLIGMFYGGLFTEMNSSCIEDTALNEVCNELHGWKRPKSNYTFVDKYLRQNDFICKRVTMEEKDESHIKVE